MKDKDKFIGKHILVGLNYIDAGNKVKERIQLHGRIINVSSNSLVFERADGRGKFSIPFDAENMTKGELDATYKLKSTGEIIENVDFISTWTISPPKK